MTTLRSLRAIVWLRWRLIKNSMIGGRKRDELEQLSRALAMIVPFLIMALSAGTFVAVCSVGFVGGRMMGDGLVAPGPGLLVVRLLVSLMVFTILALSVISPTQSATSRYTRLLLLPIPRQVLHLVEVIASLGDPWVAIVSAGLTTFAIGLYAGGRPIVAVVALAAAALTVAAVVCAGSLAGFLVAWLMRDRRRGELLTLVFVVGFSLLSFIPAFMSRSFDSGRSRPAPSVPAATRTRLDPAEVDRNLPAWTRYLPSELHGRTIAAALADDRATVVQGLGILAAEVVLLFLASGRVHRRMLNSLEGDHGRRRKAGVKMVAYRLPFMSAGSSAVAWALVRNALRSVRGRLTILLPGPMLALVIAFFGTLPRETFTAEAASRGYLLFGASLLLTFYAMHPISMNFFGSDRAGLTLQLLVPVSDREIARGKLVGFAGIIAIGGTVCLLAAMAVAHRGAPAYWLAVMLGGAATFCLVSPLAIWCSATFPVASDLSKTGSGGNPHPFALIAGLLVTGIISLPTVGILALAEFVFRSPASAVLMAAVWLVIAGAIGLPLAHLAARTITTRRENLALVAQGR
jgi:hypothetical protein